MTAARRSRTPSGIRMRSVSPEDTRTIGAALGEVLPIPAVVLLHGSLGAGKTTLVSGIAEGLGLPDPAEVHSPSFTLVNIYEARCTIYHVDLYRLSLNSDLDSLGLDEFMGGAGVSLVEWGERIPYAIEGAIEVTITDAGGDSRMLLIEGLTADRQRSFRSRGRRRGVVSSK